MSTPTTPALTAWERASAWILAAEGGYVDNPADRGGPTNMGITGPTLRAAIIDGIVSPGTTIKSLRRDQALAIYKARFWDRVHGQELPAPLALATFDGAVHSGVLNGSRWLQAALNEHGAALQADGVIGYHTLAAAQALPIYPVLESAIAFREQFLANIVARDASQRVFAKGWGARIERLRSMCVSMLPGAAA